MFTHNDLIDAVLRHLGPLKPMPKGAAQFPIKEVKGRLFLTEHEIKKALTPGARRLTIPEDAIVSPLAQEWLALKDISIVRSSSVTI